MCEFNDFFVNVIIIALLYYYAYFVVCTICVCGFVEVAQTLVYKLPSS